MKITICSALRSSTAYLTRYFVQVDALRRQLAKRGDALTLVLGEGDHTDDTRAKIPDWLDLVQVDATVVECDHGGPAFGPVVDAQRFRQLAFVWNRIWERIPAGVDVVLFLESDLIWHPNTVVGLVDRVIQGLPAVAPLVLERGSHKWYDTWGFRRDGQQFRKEPPYADRWPAAGSLLRLDSAGSCIAINGHVARRLHWPEDNVVIGLSRQIYGMAGPVWLDSELKVEHPA